MSLLAALTSHVVRRGRRVPRQGFTQLTGKNGPVGYYRGNGSAKVGRHTSKGKYVVQKEKMMRVGGVFGAAVGELKAYVGHR